jgi:3-dehydroquinate dehydratase-2
MKILCLSGPNLQLLGTRNPAVYGTTTLDEIHRDLAERASLLGIDFEARQTNHEGVLCDWLAEARLFFDGVLLNGGGLTHTSIALRDAVEAIALPTVEVHVSNPEAREPFRHHSYLSAVCFAKVAGFGPSSYRIALDGLVSHLQRSALASPEREA